MGVAVITSPTFSLIATCRQFSGAVLSWKPDERWLLLPPQAWALYVDLVEHADRELTYWLDVVRHGYGPSDYYNEGFEETLAGHRELSIADSGINNTFPTTSLHNGQENHA